MSGSRPNDIVAGYVIAAAMSCLAPVALSVAVVVWTNPADSIPNHWDFSGDPAVASSVSVFWASLLPAVACAVVAVVMAATVRADASRRATAIGFGIVILIGAALSLLWPIGQLTAADPSPGNRMGPAFALLLIAPVLGICGFAVAVGRRRA